ncbi:alkaline phosphatase family protein [Pseudoxanthomonas broegbernensis]|uniref:Alkaline phosphatase family protein n=1 Tax=Pseudoxanthomonas broegbernensis TaxID=83619 RepID=A0A7V8GPJ0_9GAMM|nr:ectonucleotide pyrophosphatase/phosphodiesterase [Pseudoxanthomonas broegbernensis]KAF1687684.1 alkaline phosphatase family protein [Pseudoxanthomonas broegbernensis]MBB6064711.1 putative AlkP superfamily pyrophosphatase or phosphodiesterase [Pseudoxanthomonas broegbernensis]
MPPRPLFRTACLALLLSLAGCAASPAPRTGANDAPALLLVSIDGLRADALGRGDTPTLDRLAARGARAQWMRPSYPALTFPNHFTLATGLRPDRHGVVHNTMRDPALGRFVVADAAAARVPGWWQAQPLWTGAERAGLVTGVWAWPGASAPIDAIVPRHFHPFDAAVPLDERMDRIAGWLAGPPPTRARFVAVYLEQVDKAGHDFGPDAAPTREAIRRVDAALGRLLAAVDTAGIAMDVVVVSDHGMAAVPEGHYLAVEDMAAMEEAEVVSVGQVVGLAPRPGHEAQVQARLLGRHPHYQCWRKADIPARLHYGSHPRIPPLVCQMDEGWNALPRQTVARRNAEGSHDRGAHGYDPDAPSMRAVFLASGPSFVAGKVLPPFDNTDVYPLLAHLLGIAAQPHDGDARTLLPALREP